MKQDKARSVAAAQDDRPVGLRYVGDGEFIPGAPARDLSAEEAEALRELLAGPAGRRLYVAMERSFDSGLRPSTTHCGAPLRMQPSAQDAGQDAGGGADV